MRGRLNDLDLRLVRVFLAVVDAGGVASAQLGLNVGASTSSWQRWRRASASVFVSAAAAAFG